ncbi:hypothetical protein J1614_006470 [Plenodomus biglobosus]|nr:hypothetical protein J1614_006470 [Plenodomus biglobosus]
MAMAMGVELGARARDLLATWRELVSGVAICSKKGAQGDMEGGGKGGKAGWVGVGRNGTAEVVLEKTNGVVQVDVEAFLGPSAAILVR